MLAATTSLPPAEFRGELRGEFRGELRGEFRGELRGELRREPPSELLQLLLGLPGTPAAAPGKNLCLLPHGPGLEWRIGRA